MKKTTLGFWIFIAVLTCWFSGIAVFFVNGKAYAQPPMDVATFVRQRYIHGIPYAEATRYGTQDVPILVQMLRDTNEKMNWSNIAVTLGVIGNESAVDALIEFLNKDEEGALSPSHYSAKTSALIALGYSINRTGSNKALSYLDSCLTPQIWEDKRLKWSSPFTQDRNERNEQLSTMAILGLGVSGNAAAARSIRSLRQPATTSAERQFRVKVRNLVDRALIENQRVSTMGLVRYNRHIEN